MHTSANTYSSLCVCLHKGIQFLNDDGVFTEPLWISCKKNHHAQQNKNAVKSRELRLSQSCQTSLRHMCILRELKSVVAIYKGGKGSQMPESNVMWRQNVVSNLWVDKYRRHWFHNYFLSFFKVKRPLKVLGGITLALFFLMWTDFAFWTSFYCQCLHLLFKKLLVVQLLFKCKPICVISGGTGKFHQMGIPKLHAICG